MPAQAPAGGVTNPQLLDRDGIVQSALLQIVLGLGVAIELLLIERRGLLQDGVRVGGSSTLLLEVSEALAEGQMAGQLDKAQEIAALAATVTVEEIFAGVYIERGPGFRVQRTKSDELAAVTGRSTGPILLPQIVEQRQALFEFFDILAHGVVLPPEANVEEGRRHSQARMVGHWKFLSDARAKEFAELESAQTKAQLRDRLDPHALASERRERAFGGERKGPAGSGPGRATNGGAWRNRARGLGL